MRLPLSLQTVATAALCLTASVTSSPLLRHEVDALPDIPQPTLERRQGSFQAVTGIQFGIQPRLEIRQLEQNADQWNLFLLGLARFQATNQTDKISYYQIAGIHGRPYYSWDGVGPGPGDPGYCMHVSNLFLPWHRPYLALFEQALYTHIIVVVNEFPAGSVRQRYASAALSWRLPYWDWAAVPPSGQSVYPDSVTTETVTVTLPNGTADISNPLFSYRFHPVVHNDFYFDPFASWNETMRYPTSWDSNAVSQNALVGPILDNNRVSFQDRLYNLFTYYDNFTQFGNEAWYDNNARNFDSLESVHDIIHAITGTQGHMTFLDYSAFDPLFWLHHAMLDRCFAMWQAVWNDSYVEPMAAQQATYVVNVGDMEDENSALEPFHSDSSGSFWTAASVRSIRSFGYTYADLGDGSANTVKANINKLYGSSAGNSGLSKRSGSTHSAVEREVAGAADPTVTAPEWLVDGRYRQYLANIQSEKLALNGTYAIYIFMGDFEDDPASWALSPNLVGTHAVFAALSTSDASTSKKARRQADTSVQVAGAMPLTSMLLTKVQSGDLACMDVETVTAYLQQNMQWRVGMFDGSQVPAQDLSQLVVTVVSAEVEPAFAEDAFPSWGDFTVLANVTQGKPGGCP